MVFVVLWCGRCVQLELGYNPMGPEGPRPSRDTIKFHGNVETLRLGWCKSECPPASSSFPIPHAPSSLHVLCVFSMTIAQYCTLDVVTGSHRV